MKLPHYSYLLCILGLLAAACSSVGAPTATPVPPTPTAEPKTDCTASDLKLYRDSAGRYSVPYPATFEVRHEAAEQVAFYGPALDLSLEPVAATLSIQVEGQLGGRSLIEVMGNSWEVCNRPASRCLRQGLVIGGEPAEMLQGVFGENPVGSRQAFLIHADTVYHVSLYPVDPNFEQAMPDGERMWKTLVDCFVFLQ